MLYGYCIHMYYYGTTLRNACYLGAEHLFRPAGAQRIIISPVIRCACNPGLNEKKTKKKHTNNVYDMNCVQVS